MKKANYCILLFVLCLLTSTITLAQTKRARLYTPEFNTETMEGVFGSIYGVSANGEYAVGYDDFLGTCAFMWSRATGEFEKIDLASMMMDVANDGTAVGNYFVEIPGSDNGSFASRPGYYKNGEWKPLPIHRSEVLLTPSTGESDDLNGCATAISTDARFIAGYITDTNVYKLFPVLWKWNEELQDYEIAEEYVNIQENIDALDCPYGWVVRDMSDDGTILSGFSEWGSGARSAAVLVNGEEVRLTTLIDPLEKDPDVIYISEGDAFVSDNGEHVAGFFSEEEGVYNSFTWTPGQESALRETSTRIYRTVDDDGTIYGSTTILGDASMYKNGEEILLSDVYTWDTPTGAYLSTIFANSNGGEVLGGIAYVSFTIGAINIPAVLVVDIENSNDPSFLVGDKFTVDGIHYQVLPDSGQVAVTYYGDDESNVPEEYIYKGVVTIPEAVTYQGVTYSVTEIGVRAFDDCYGLTEITIPSSVTSIDNYAFSRCTGLTSIVVEEGNTVYDSRENCNAIIETSTNTLVIGCMNTVIPNSVTSIGNSAFSYCTGLTDITIPNSVTSIGSFAFAFCSSLNEVTIGNSVASIGDYAFEYCYGLTSVTIGNSVASIGDYAFYDCSGLTEITIPNSVTSIGVGAFSDCTGLISVTIGNSVTEIGDHAFSDCTRLASIVVEGGNTAYDSRENCNAIIETATNTLVKGCKNTVIPNSVISIGNEAFFLCKGLTEVVIPNSVNAIGTTAFSGCDNLESIVVKEGNIVYDSRDNCNAIIKTATNTLVAGCKNTTIPNSVTSIGEWAFANFKNLTSIIIPNGVTSIGEYAFVYCTGLTSIRVEGVNPPVIAENTFKNIDKSIPLCVPAESVEAYRTAEYWSEFTNIVGYTELAEVDKFTVDGIHYQVLPESRQVAVTYYGDDEYNVPDEYKYTGSVVIPEAVTYQGATYSVTAIGQWAFNVCDGLTSIRIETVNPPTIYDDTFYWVDKSIPLYVPAESVEAYRTAEYWCEFTNIIGYTELVEGDKFTVDGVHYEVLTETDEVAVTYYEEYKYTGSVVIPETVTYQGVTYSVTEIGEDAFFKCTGLTDIAIPNSVTSIEMYAFHDCTGLTEVTIPNSVTSIGYEAFSFCTSLTEITIPNSVTSIGYEAFRYCTSLTEITIPNSVTSIEKGAFRGCTGLIEITIPNSLTSIGSWAFSDCTGLTSMVVEEGNTVYDSRDNCNAIIETASNTLVAGCKNTTIPNNVTSIGDYAFCGCTGLTEITIPNSVTSIGEAAFRGCYALTEISIPNSVISIGYEAFSGCTGLTSIRLEGVNPPVIEENTFKGVDKSIPVYVPMESVEAYLTAEYWSEFTNIVGYTELSEGDKFTVDGIHYQVLPESGQVAVTYYGEDMYNVPEEYIYKGVVTIPEAVTYQGATYSVTSIGYRAFYSCDGLTEIFIPNSVTSIDNSAFSYCDGLTDITIPNSVTSIGAGAFASCKGLTSIVVEEGNTVYDSRENCNAIIETVSNTLIAGCMNTTIPNNVTSIGDYAFYGCSGLTEIVIGNSVASIGGYAFSGCTGLMTITIPSSVTAIGWWAFEGCTGLTSIRIEAVNPPTIYDNTFYWVDKSIPVYVPAESVEAYRTVRRWSEFTNIIAYTETLTYNVTVPEGTPACYIVGDFSDWYDFVPMERVDETHYTITLGSVTKLMTYKYTCGPDWQFVEMQNLPNIVGGVDVPNRIYHDNDTVKLWNIVYRPGENFVGPEGDVTIYLEKSTAYTTTYLYAFDGADLGIWPGIEMTEIEKISGREYLKYTFVSPEKVVNIRFSDGNGNETYGIALVNEKNFYRIDQGSGGISKIDLETLTYNVTVPAGTPACYIVGEFNEWDSRTAIEMEKVDETHYTATLDYVTRYMQYKFLCGKDWIYEEYDNGPTHNRTWSENDTVVEWACIPITATWSIEECAVLDAFESVNLTFTGVESAKPQNTYGCTYFYEKNAEGEWQLVVNGCIAGYMDAAKNGTTITFSLDPMCYSQDFISPFNRKGEYRIVVPAGDIYFNGDRTNVNTEEYVLNFTIDYVESANNLLQADDVTVAELDGVLSQARVALPIALVNEAAISAVQCDIYLPAGLSIATTESGMDIALSDRAGESHTLMTKALANGAMRIVIMSASAEALTGNEGTLFTLGLLPNENYNTESQIVIRNITMTDTDIVEYTPEQVVVNCRIRQSILGDANRDNKINVTDIVLLAKYILNDYHGDFDALAGDVNQDGKINVSDIVAMANKILSGEGAAGAPTRQEGEKGTLRMDEVQINGENSATASLMLDNSVSYSAFQMDVILPDGVEIAAIERSERISEYHQLMWKEQADGRVRILVFAIDNSEIAAHEGALFDMQLRAQSGFTAGELQVTDATFVTRGTTTHHIDDLAVGVSRTSDLTGNHVGNRVYATGRTLVIESSEAQEARITTADGLSQSIALQPGRNEYPMTQQGVYIVTLGNDNKKVIVK